MNYLEIILIIGIAIAFFYIGIQTQIFNKSIVTDFIISHYENINLVVSKIHKLDPAERFKYGVSVFSFLHFNNNMLPRKSPTNYSRKVELFDKDGNEYTKYIEIRIRDNEVIDFNEFDSYDI